MELSQKEFERTVSQAIDDLPEYFRRQMVNVAIVVEDWADDETLDEADVEEPEDLLGFYFGVPLSERTSYYGLVPPDKISLFRMPILRQCSNLADVVAAVRRTLRHEIAHYFGIDDDRLEEIGAY